MTGLKYHRLLQARSINNLAALTGSEENTIARCEEQIIPNEPCHTYMRLASALGITVDELVANRPDERDPSLLPNNVLPESGRDSSLWESSFDLRTGTLCRPYLAKINGLHPKFYFDREFQQMTVAFSGETMFCSADQLEEGVYEVCARWYKYGSNTVVDRSVSWFAYYDGEICTLDKDDVLTIVSPAGEGYNTGVA